MVVTVLALEELAANQYNGSNSNINIYWNGGRILTRTTCYPVSLPVPSTV